MLHLAVVQAAYGDCLVLEYRRGDRMQRILVDGGPSGTFAAHLGSYLNATAAMGAITTMVLSHVDTDHVDGLLDYVDGLADHLPLPLVAELWHNSVDSMPPDVRTAPRVSSAVNVAADAMPQLAAALLGFAQGAQLTRRALQLAIPRNAPFPNGLILADTAPVIERDGLRIDVIGPRQANLDALHRKWREWLRDHEDLGADADPQVMAAADRSVPNLSSVCLLVTAGKRTVLLTGDAHGDDVVEGLRLRGLLSSDDTIRVDVLKMPHHGSARNVTPEFFERVIADRYVFSADGRHGNPDLVTMKWLVEAGRRQGRRVQIVATNDTDALRQLRTILPPTQHGYAVRTLAPDRHWLRLRIA